ncbi:site-specific integrase [Streptomyces sp. NP160]|uniref:site-specific integrase n=1 Tax=Streptomyces sp. NP160 TaxID=2586637 RepID=UPI00111A3ACC|nr:site-specific integrase [Streptomyces sp. NP160]TNM60422.1 site-specific integrase [Streptomyces sp. NP160]
MAFPASPGVDADADVGASESVGLDGVVDDGFAPEIVPGLDTGIAVDGDDRDSVDEDLGDEAVLDGAAIEGQLELASLGVLPQLAGLPEREAAYARAARAENTLRGYRFDWADFTTWCTTHAAEPMPASPSALTGYLVALAEAGAKVGTLSRRLSSIKFAHASAGHPDPATHPRVMAVWEGIRRLHGAPPQQAAPLMPPLLFDVLAACPVTRTWPAPALTASGRPSRAAVRAPEPDLTGARDRALLLVGFVGALRRSELAALEVADVAEHPNGLVLSLPRSKTNQTGSRAELVVLPRAGNPDRCPVLALQRWLELADITEGPVFRGVTKANRPAQRRLHPESVTTLVKGALARTGAPTTGYSGHSLRAGFVTYAHLRGSSDRAIAHQTRHRSMASLGGYVRVSHAWTDNAATALGL